MHVFIALFSIFYIIILTCVFYMAYAAFSGAPFVPSKRAKAEKMIELANLKPSDKAVDLGSGDGRIAFAAGKLCAQSDGVELNPCLFWLSRSKQKALGATNTSFMRGSLWNFNLAPYDVVFIYFIPHRMKKLARKIRQEMKPGSRIVSNAFSFPSWQFVKKDSNVYLYVV